MIIVAALYKFVALPDYVAVRDILKKVALQEGIRGTLLLAREGINGTVAGTREAIDRLKAVIELDNRFDGLEYKESFHDRNPFFRLKVKLKKEIVTLGRPEADPSAVVGEYVEAHAWNELLGDPQVTVLDVRNDYEVAIGTFKRAVDPKTKTFREFPEFVKNHLDPRVNKKIAMCCTGGIRCEKASSFLKTLGFEEVYHLKGGILKYLEDMPENQSLWTGDCFVFDKRVAVNHQLAQGDHESCFGCRRPLSAEHKKSPAYVEGVCCPQCSKERSDDQKARSLERQMQIKIAKKRGRQHMG